MIEILPLDTPSLGDRSYLAHDGEVAVVVDPQRDIDRVVALAREHGVRITHVFETHVHNDYVTGGYELARQVGAEYLLNADDPVSFSRRGLRDGDLVTTGRLQVRAVHTPGHTFTHLSYVLAELPAAGGPAGAGARPDVTGSPAPGGPAPGSPALADAPAAGEPSPAGGGGTVAGVFTGGSLLYGSTGRPDLLGVQHADTLARHQYASAHRLAAELPGGTGVFPTHGFGSFCSATQAEGLASTIAQEAAGNPVLLRDEQAYVDELLAGLGAYPAYYAHMAPRNSTGPGPIDLSPPAPADPAELRRRIDAGEWVVDLRERTAFAAGHVAGTVNLGLDGSFVTYLGWLLPWDTPVTLLGESADDVAEAQRDLVRIGVDRPAAAATGKPEEWTGEAPLASYRRAGFAELAAERPGYVLDVRRDDERSAGFVAGTRHIPLHNLAERLADVPTDGEVWVHCAAGYRASIGASLLARAGRRVVLVDDEFEDAAAAGLSIQQPVSS